MNAVFSMGIAWAIASATAPVQAPEPTIAVEVDVSALPDEDFTRWLEENLIERQKTVLHDGGIEVAEGADADATIRVTVSRYGDLGVHYRFTVTLTETGATTPKAEHTLPCELCKDSVLVTKVGDEVARMSGRFMYEREEAARVEARDAGAEAVGTEPGESKRVRRVGGAGWAGIGLAAVGVGFGVGGAVELAKPGTWDLRPDDNRYEVSVRPRALGVALLGVGGSLLVTGAVLLAVDQTVLLERRRRRGAADVPRAFLLAHRHRRFLERSLLEILGTAESSTMHTRSFIVLGYALLFSGCNDVVSTRRNVDHCTWNGGDGYCADRTPDMPYCAAGYGDCLMGGRYGCVAEVTPECHAPCGEPGDLSCVEGESSTGTSTGSEGGTESSSGSSDSSTTTGPMPCVSDEECTDAEAPFCGMTGECGTCDGTPDPDTACAGVDPGLPLCVGDACVACTPENPVVCDEQQLLCDGGTNACVPCTEHGQCGSGACELAVGTCFPADVVVTVDDAGAMPMPDYTSIEAAVSAAGAGEHRVVVVHELDGDAPYLGTVTVNGGKRIALLAAPGEDPVILGTMAGNPGVLVEGPGTILYMDGLRVAGNTGGLGLRVDDAFAWVDRSHIVQNSGGGVLAENGAELTLRNCFVGGSVNNVAALSVSNATATLTYVTAGAGFGVATALTCDVAATVDARNSLFVSEDAGGDEIQCPGVTIEHSAAELDLGGTNVGLGDMATTWFMGYGTGDFHLVPAHPVAIDTAALWTTGDPLTDIDGDPRPNIDGTPDYAGADVP